MKGCFLFMPTMIENTKIRCSSCGTSQVNHGLMFTLRFFDEFFSVIGYIYSPLFSLGNRRDVTDYIEKCIFNILSLLRVIRYDADIEKTINTRSKVVWQEAKDRGIHMEQLFFLGKPFDHFRARVNGKIIFFNSIPIPSWLPHGGYAWVDDKLVFAKKLQSANFPSPKTKRIIFFKDALRAFDDFRKPMIIKPQQGSLGRHTTTNINTKDELKKAFDLARQITLSMVAQEHIFGSVYRATVVNNTLVGFFRADRPYVEGDGISTIEELIKNKNRNHPEKVSDIVVSDEVLNFLARQGYTVASIPDAGVTVDLIAKTGRFYGGYTKEILPEVHPKFHSIFEKLGEFVSIPVAGFDLIIEDPTRDPDTQHWGVIECNSLPFIDLHYFPLEGKPVNIAKYVWDLWEKK